MRGAQVRVKEAGHYLFGLFRFGQLDIVPECVRERFKDDELGVDTGAQKRPVQDGGAAQQQVASTRDEKRGREAFQGESTGSVRLVDPT